MSALFRLPIPGELLWGACSRFQARFPTFGPDVISELLLEAPGKAIWKLFPIHLEALSTALKHSAKPTGPEFLANHTMYPFAAPFLEPEDARAAKTNMLGSDHRDLKWTRLCHRAIGADLGTVMRFCPDCATDDLRAIGAPVWRRIHQVGPLKLCPTHNCPLVETKVLRTDRAYVPLDPLVAGRHQGSPSLPSPLQLGLAKDVAEIANNPHWEVGPEKLLEACRIEWRSSGRSLLGRSALPDFVEDLTEKFGRDELRLCDAAIDNVNTSWAAAIFRSARTSVGFQHYSAFCAFLGISLKDLIAKAVLVSERESGPWPCLAHGQPCRGKLTIQFKRMDAVRCEEGQDAFRFQCPDCGTVYFRPAPLTRNPDGNFEYELSRWEIPDWALQLKDLWQDTDQTWVSLAARLDQTRSSIGLHAAKLGLPTIPGRCLDSFYKALATQSDRLTRIALRRAALVKFMEENPAVTCSAAPTAIQNLFSWLRLNDSTPLPSFATSGKHWSRGKIGIAARDEEVAEIIHAKLKDAESELKRPGKPRVSVTSVLRFFAPTLIIPARALSDMPKTSVLIAGLVESKEQHRTRRLADILNAIAQAQALPTWYRVYHRYRVQAMSPAERTTVRTAFQQRHHINRNGPVAAA